MGLGFNLAKTIPKKNGYSVLQSWVLIQYLVHDGQILIQPIIEKNFNRSWHWLQQMFGSTHISQCPMPISWRGRWTCPSCPWHDHPEATSLALCPEPPPVFSWGVVAGEIWGPKNPKMTYVANNCWFSLVDVLWFSQKPCANTLGITFQNHQKATAQKRVVAGTCISPSTADFTSLSLKPEKTTESCHTTSSWKRFFQTCIVGPQAEAEPHHCTPTKRLHWPFPLLLLGPSCRHELVDRVGTWCTAAPQLMLKQVGWNEKRSGFGGWYTQKKMGWTGAKTRGARLPTCSWSPLLSSPTCCPPQVMVLGMKNVVQQPLRLLVAAECWRYYIDLRMRPKSQSCSQHLRRNPSARCDEFAQKLDHAEIPSIGKLQNNKVVLHPHRTGIFSSSGWSIVGLRTFWRSAPPVQWKLL